MKKLIAFALCLVMLLGVFAGCASENDEKEEDPACAEHLFACGGATFGVWR